MAEDSTMYNEEVSRSRIAGNINLMNYFLTFVVSTDGACINEALTSLDV